ncbi:MAG: hypothetical protein JNK48_34635 [Bryobacterales bacterium]|nr:hypothetical protein [Bryobacterales bacterium]
MKTAAQPSKQGEAWSIPQWTDIRELIEPEGACLSVYLGSHLRGGGTAATVDRIRTLLPDLDEALVDRGVLAPDREDLLTPIRALARDPSLDKGHEGGLAIFRSLHLLEVYRLPWPVAETWRLEGRFYLRPLWEMLVENPSFLVLALARKRVRLLEWTAGTTREVPLPANVPTNLEDFGAFKQPDHDLMGKSSAGPGTGKMGGVIFGTGAGHDKEYHQLHDFHKAIDRGLRPVLNDVHFPMVLAGTETDVASYLRINTYPLILVEAVSGSPDGGWSDAEITQLAGKIVHRWTPDKQRKALADMDRASPREKSKEINRIVVSAQAGRVLHLFVASGAGDLNGNLDRLSGRVLLSGEFRSTNDDFLNAAMVQTLRHEGNVWMLPPDRMPDKAAIAALFRY